jgi:cytosine permease
MMADYLLAGRKWAGPRAGFNMAGWISWAAGFVVGAMDLVGSKIDALSFLQVGVPCPPMAALIVGFVLYAVLAKIGLEGKTLDVANE